MQKSSMPTSSLSPIELEALLEDTVKEPETWKKCPSCAEEWAKLRLCMPSGSSVCVHCAEAIRGLPWIVKQWPIFDNWTPTVKESWLNNVPAFVYWHRGLPDQQRVYFWKHRIAKLWLDNKMVGRYDFLLSSREGDLPISVTNVKASSTQYYDNAIQAWFAIKKKVLNPEAE